MRSLCIGAWAWSLVALTLSLGGCAEAEVVAARLPPEGTHELSGGSDHWDGWLELEPAIRTPRTRQEVDRTRIYARFPEGALVSLASPADRRALVVPAGSELDRVELRLHGGAWVVADVRGTRFEEEGEIFHAYRPLDEHGDRLFGAAWPRERPAAARRASEDMGAALRAGVGVLGSGLSQESLERTSTRYERLLACAACHGARAPERELGEDEWPRRATDASGLYSLLATLEDEQIVETYRPRDANEGDRFVTRTCTDGSSPRVRASGWPRCDDGRAPFARLDVAAARRAGDAHAEAVCASRRALAAYLADDVRAAYARELEECR